MSSQFDFSRRSAIKYLIGIFAGVLLGGGQVHGKKFSNIYVDLIENYDIQPSVALNKTGAPILRIIGYGFTGLQVLKLLKRHCKRGLDLLYLPISEVLTAFAHDRINKTADMTFIAFDLDEVSNSNKDGLFTILKASNRNSKLSFAVFNWPTSPQQISKKLHNICRIKSYADTVLITRCDHTPNIPDQMHKFSNIGASSLCMAIQSITCKMTHAGFVCLDFADFMALFKNAGFAFPTIGIGKGINECINSVDRAISYLNGGTQKRPIIQCKAVYANIHSSKDITINEITMFADYFYQKIPSEAELLWGHVINENMGGDIRVDCMPIMI